jgi:hypothetical protein
MPKPDDETVLLILTILELLGKRESPEEVTRVYRMYEKTLQQRPIK